MNIFRLFSLIFILSFLACGENDTKFISDDESSRIYSLELSASELSLGQVLTIDLEFRPATDTPVDLNPVDGFPSRIETKRFEVVIKLPRGLDYIMDSSLLKDSYLPGESFGDAEIRNPHSTGLCLNGTRFLRYVFEDQELSNENPLVAAIRLKAVAFERNTVGLVGVATNSDFPDYCSIIFDKKVDIDIQ